MERQSRFLATVAACAWTLCTLAATARGDTLVVAADGQTRSIAGHTPPGTLQSIHVKNRGPGGENRGYLRFDLSSLPDGASVDKAVLRLWANDVDHGGTVEVAPAFGPWDEKTLTAHNAPALGPAVASFSVAHASERHFVSVDITDLVRDWLSGALANNGLALVGNDNAPVDVKFDSKENVLTSHAPEAEVALVTAGKGQPGLQGPPGPQGDQGPAGPPGTLANFDGLVGLPCTRNGSSGSVSLTYSDDGSATLRCVVASPPPPEVPPGKCLDGTLVRDIVSPSVGDLVITEILQDPAQAFDPTGEWFEVYVMRDVDVNGLEIGTTPGTPLTTINDPQCRRRIAGTSLVFARNANQGLGLPPAEATFGFALVNTAGTLYIGVGGQRLDAVAWLTSSQSAAASLDRGSYDPAANDDPAHWCVATTAYGNGLNMGTPGATNPRCP